MSEHALFYLAYGSNLHPMRLARRAPSSRLLGITSLSGFRLGFHKRGQDGSGKCSIIPDGDVRSRVYAAVYRLPGQEKAVLDQAEGVGRGYDQIPLRVALQSRKIEVFTYIASPSHLDFRIKPFDWYRDLVLWGTIFHRFPPEYTENIARVEAVFDPSTSRRSEHQRLVQAIADRYESENRGTSGDPHINADGSDEGSPA